MELHRPSNLHILLTGAGFTHNFGAPLADGMWSWIFNHPKVRSTKRISDLMRDNFDFEDVYHEVMYGDYTEDERSAIHAAVLDAYNSIDDIVQEWIPKPGLQSVARLNTVHLVKQLITIFAGDKHKCGFFFTLNQDLFVERFLEGRYTDDPISAPLTPGLRPLDRTSRCILPNDEEIEENANADLRKAHFCYVKLHGSYDWQRHDGSPQLVIGAGKEEIISREPILRWNWELFKAVLRQENRRLLVVGYGFRDKHVNKELTNAIANHGLRLIILCPVNPREFFDERLLLADEEHGNAIRKAIDGYFPHTLEELFPTGQMNAADVAHRLVEAVTE